MSNVLTGWLLAKNPPQVGTVDNFTVEQQTSKTGKPYLRFKRNGLEYGGKPYQIVSATQNFDYSDAHNNLSFNLGITPADGSPAVVPPQQAPQQRAAQGGDYQREYSPATQARVHRAVAFEGAVRLVAANQREGLDVIATVGTYTDLLLPIVTGASVTPQGNREEGANPPTPTQAPVPAPVQPDDDIPF